MYLYTMYSPQTVNSWRRGSTNPTELVAWMPSFLESKIPRMLSYTKVAQPKILPSANKNTARPEAPNLGPTGGPHQPQAKRRPRRAGTRPERIRRRRQCGVSHRLHPCCSRRSDRVEHASQLTSEGHTSMMRPAWIVGLALPWFGCYGCRVSMGAVALCYCRCYRRL